MAKRVVKLEDEKKPKPKVKVTPKVKKKPSGPPPPKPKTKPGAPAAGSAAEAVKNLETNPDAYKGGRGIPNPTKTRSGPKLKKDVPPPKGGSKYSLKGDKPKLKVIKGKPVDWGATLDDLDKNKPSGVGGRTPPPVPGKIQRGADKIADPLKKTSQKMRDIQAGIIKGQRKTTRGISGGMKSIREGIESVQTEGKKLKDTVASIVPKKDKKPASGTTTKPTKPTVSAADKKVASEKLKQEKLKTAEMKRAERAKKAAEVKAKRDAKKAASLDKAKTRQAAREAAKTGVGGAAKKKFLSKQPFLGLGKGGFLQFLAGMEAMKQAGVGFMGNRSEDMSLRERAERVRGLDPGTAERLEMIRRGEETGGAGTGKWTDEMLYSLIGEGSRKKGISGFGENLGRAYTSSIGQGAPMLWQGLSDLVGYAGTQNEGYLGKSREELEGMSEVDKWKAALMRPVDVFRDPRNWKSTAIGQVADPRGFRQSFEADISDDYRAQLEGMIENGFIDRVNEILANPDAYSPEELATARRAQQSPAYKDAVDLMADFVPSEAGTGEGALPPSPGTAPAEGPQGYNRWLWEGQEMPGGGGIPQDPNIVGDPRAPQGETMQGTPGYGFRPDLPYPTMPGAESAQNVAGAMGQLPHARSEEDARNQIADLQDMLDSGKLDPAQARQVSAQIRLLEGQAEQLHDPYSPQIAEYSYNKEPRPPTRFESLILARAANSRDTGLLRQAEAIRKRLAGDTDTLSEERELKAIMENRAANEAQERAMQMLKNQGYAQRGGVGGGMKPNEMVAFGKFLQSQLEEAELTDAQRAETQAMLEALKTQLGATVKGGPIGKE